VPHQDKRPLHRLVLRCQGHEGSAKTWCRKTRASIMLFDHSRERGYFVIGGGFPVFAPPEILRRSSADSWTVSEVFLFAFVSGCGAAFSFFFLSDMTTSAVKSSLNALPVRYESTLSMLHKPSFFLRLCIYYTCVSREDFIAPGHLG